MAVRMGLALVVMLGLAALLWAIGVAR
jgi:hypothetical protein